MNNYDVVAYLFFLKRNSEHVSIFFNELFHFNRFCALSEKLDWKKLFVFESYQVKDCDFDSIINTLVFHQLISDNYRLTPLGEEYLKNESNNVVFLTLFDDFLSYYNGESATTNSCFTEQELLAVSCGFCHHKSCLKNKMSLIELLPFSLKKRKNPYRSVTF